MDLIPTVPKGSTTAVPPVRTWTAGVVVLASHRARVVESADRPSETGDETMAGTRVQAARAGRPRRGRPGRDRAGGGGEGVHRRRPRRQGRRAVDLRIAEGEFFSLLGPSGCGKTTTLRMIAGFEEPTSGQILLHGRDMVGVPPFRRDVNMVFQQYALFPHMDVFENVAFGLRRKKVDKDEIGGGWPRRWPWSSWRAGRSASRASCRAASSSGSPWPGPWSTGHGPCCWTSRWRPRPQAAPGHAAGAETDPARGRDHLRVRHPRPGGGPDHVRPAGGDERRPDRAARQPARAVRAPGDPVRGQLHRDLEHPHRPAGAQGRHLGPGRLGPDQRVLVADAGHAQSGQEVELAVRPEKIVLRPSRTHPRPTAPPSGSRSTRSSTSAPRPSTGRSPMAATAVAVYRQNASATPGADVLAGQVGWLEWPPSTPMCSAAAPRRKLAVTRNRPLDPAWLRGMTMPRISRRDALRGAGLLGASAFLAACGVEGSGGDDAPQESGFWASQTKAGQLNSPTGPCTWTRRKGRQDRVPLAPGLHQGDGDQGQLQGGHRGQRRLPGQDQPSPRPARTPAGT